MNHARTHFTNIESQLFNIIHEISQDISMYRNLIESDPNYAIRNGIPRKRGMKKFSKEQKELINDYANKNGIDSVEAMRILSHMFD